MQFGFDAKASVTEQAESVLQAMADGAVSPGMGKQIIAALYGIKQIDELARHFEALEG